MMSPPRNASRALILFVTSSLAASGLVACATAPEPVANAHELVEQGATLLDVRTPGEYESGHIEGALSIPLQSLESRLEEIPTDQSVVVYCQSGGRSARAAGILREAGYEVLDLGAMASWHER